MKCLKCHKNSLYRERSGGKCSGCGQAFVFEPKRGDLFTDTGFQKAIEHASLKGSLSYQPRQLYYELARMRMKRPGVVISKLGSTLVAGFVGLFLAFFWTGFWINFLHMSTAFWVLEGLYLLLWGGAMVTAWKGADPNRMALEPKHFEAGLKKWLKHYGSPPGMQKGPLALPTAKGQEKDVLDYAVERAIVCDQQEVVDFLLANSFHIEQKCAILSVGGYPPARFEDVRSLLRRNPDLHVFVLHNASVNGCRIYQDLITRPEWFPGSRRVFDIGLHPRHAKAFKGLWQQATSKEVPDIPGYAPDELAWLGKYKLELMAVRPDILLKRLRNVINGHSRSLADAYARGDDGGGDGGMDLMIVGTSFDGGSDDDFG